MSTMLAVSVQSRLTLMAAAISLATLNKSQQGQLLFEGRYNAAKQLYSQLHYIWLNNTPVGFVVKDNISNNSSDNNVNNNGDWKIYAIHTDHLNTPRLLTNQDGAEVWRWSSDAFGDSQTTGSIEFNLRFPGQYYDGESGLHYNYFRDYNAQTGRYVQSDPIGLRGGLNTYLYANGNAVNYADPLGLEVLVGQHPAFVNVSKNPFNHAAIVLKPDRPQDFMNHPLFVDTKGQLATLGGQAFGDGAGLFGRLQSAFNYPGDNPDHLQNLTTVCPPSGQSDTAFITALISVAEAYNNTALYDPFPDPWGLTYNSNSYISGLLKTVGVTPPFLPGITPGYNRPLPYNNFRN